MTTTDPLAEAVEAAAQAIARERFMLVFPHNMDSLTPNQRSQCREEARRALEAAAPLLREQTLAPIRALCDEWERNFPYASSQSGCAAQLRTALGDPS